MRSSTGRWVSGDDFFNRDGELSILESRIRDGNHIVMTGQRRMGKTSILQELGRRLEEKGWIFLFADVEGAISEEDVVTKIAEAVHRYQPLPRRAWNIVGRRSAELWRRVKQIRARDFAVEFRSVLDAGNWRHHGHQLVRRCASFDKPVVVAVDEVPIFLSRLLREEDGAARVDVFLSWLRAAFQQQAGTSAVLVVSGSIGLAPLVQRLGISDRINHLDPFRLGPWDRETSVGCFEELAASGGFAVDEGVAEAVYDCLGIGIPQHVQSFFARLRDYALRHDRECITMEDVDAVYRTELLGPSGQNDLAHYEARLRDGVGDETRYGIAMEILAEAAVQGVFTPEARHHLETRYSKLPSNAPRQVIETLDVLVHDGYLESDTEGYRFASNLLRDWWRARFRDHYTPLTVASRTTSGEIDPK